MSEHFKGVPYAPPINPFRLGSFKHDLDRVIALKKEEYLFRKKQTAGGLEYAKKFGWRMAMGQKDLKLHSKRDLLNGSIEHAIVLFLPTQMLLDIQKGFGLFRRLRGNIRAGLQEPWV